MKPPRAGCALCGSTWGNYWEAVEGKRLFFCCPICATAFKNLLREVKARTGWRRLEKIEVSGDFRGRYGVVTCRGNRYRFSVRFGSKGELVAFSEEGAIIRREVPPGRNAAQWGYRYDRTG